MDTLDTNHAFKNGNAFEGSPEQTPAAVAMADLADKLDSESQALIIRALLS